MTMGLPSCGLKNESSERTRQEIITTYGLDAEYEAIDRQIFALSVARKLREHVSPHTFSDARQRPIGIAIMQGRAVPVVFVYQAGSYSYQTTTGIPASDLHEIDWRGMTADADNGQLAPLTVSEDTLVARDTSGSYHKNAWFRINIGPDQGSSPQTHVGAGLHPMDTVSSDCGACDYDTITRLNADIFYATTIDAIARGDIRTMIAIINDLDHLSEEPQA